MLKVTLRNDFITFKDTEDSKFKAMKRTLGIPKKEDVKNDIKTEAEKIIAKVLAPDKRPFLLMKYDTEEELLAFVQNYNGVVKN